jgi:hypothetical protein
MKQLGLCLVAGLMLGTSGFAQTPVGTALTYQGELRDNGFPANGLFDFQFSLFDAITNGVQKGGTVSVNAVAVSDGRFTVEIDFGSGVITGDDCYLEIDVSPSGQATFVTLDPRQELTAVPYAQHALNAGQWANSGSAIMNTNPGFVGVNRDYAVGSEWFGVHAPVGDGAYGGMYVTTESDLGRPFYGYHTGAEKGWHYIDGATGDWHLNLDGDRFTVTDSGDVGIGNTNPQYKLDVTGSLAVQGVSDTQTVRFEGPEGNFRFLQQLDATDQASWSFRNGTAGTSDVVIDTAGSVGIGTTSPGHRLHVRSPGDKAILAEATHGSNSTIGVHGTTASNSGFAYGVMGEVTNASGPGVGVYGKGPFYGVTGEATGAGVGVIGRSSLGVYGESSASGGTGVMGANNASSGTTYGVYGISNSTAGYAGYFAGRGYFDDDLGVGTTPSHRLHVEEAVADTNIFHLKRAADATSSSDLLELEMGVASDAATQFIECQFSNNDVKFRVWADGDVSADGVFTPGGADYAESVYVSEGADSVQPGDVMVIDPANPRAFVKSASARSTLVAGIYSAKPGVLGSEHDWDELEKTMPGAKSTGNGESPAIRPQDLGRMMDEVPMAIVGIVPCKVSAENGRIEAGDLLVTSSTPGHAMRDDDPAVGTVMGKALGSLSKSRGVINVLVTLQ